MDPRILSIPGYQGRSWDVPCYGDYGSRNTKYPGIPGTILGCPMLGDHGILSIPGYQGRSWDVPCYGDHGSRNTKYPGIPGTILGCPMLGRHGSQNTKYPGIPGTIHGMGHPRRLYPGILSILGSMVSLAWDIPGSSLVSRDT